ncbi:hypothetical protein [Haloplasma contractile]|uniref:Uncharacterized protein n=1 Tax=Haloplasma contractile SSD-17B TaxID=1033810 RepID=U2EDA5_9MOLU|nr:hypothetical protein [Haloplasma contractile]ERJ12983.1 hypothetical protein HLPCO_000582 [Haloplasma contractile SSD-17B]
MNIDKKMKELINGDFNVITLIHSVLSVKERNKKFVESGAYREVFEPTIMTIMKRIWKLIMISMSFVLSLMLISMYSHLMSNSFIILIAVLTLVFTYSFKRIIDRLKELKFDLRLKKAIRFAFKHYSSKSFDILVDQYLSEYSSKGYMND